MRTEPRFSEILGIRGTGIVFCILGLILTIGVLLTLGNNSNYPELVVVLCAEITLGLYFLGLSIVSQSYISLHDRTLLIEDIKKAIRKLDYENNLNIPQKIDETTRQMQIEQTTLEINFESMVLTAVSVASAVEVGFIGILGLSDTRTQIISVIFIILMVIIWCQYKQKINEIRKIFTK